MATRADVNLDGRAGRLVTDDGRFFLISAIIMTLLIITGFSVNLAMGRSSFAAPLVVHAHAIVFMGWVGIYLAQNVLVATGNTALHRRLGWIGAGWMVAMVVLGFLITVAAARTGRIPYIFRPAHFLIFDPLTIIAFAGLTAAAIRLRRDTAWHRRLHFCAMSLLLGPAFGRLLPMPLLAPLALEAAFAATMLFPAAGVIADWRRDGRVHPAWWWGIGAMLVTLVVIELVAYSALGVAAYAAVTDGTPGAAIPAMGYSTTPPGPPPQPIG